MMLLFIIRKISVTMLLWEYFCLLLSTNRVGIVEAASFCRTMLLVIRFRWNGVFLFYIVKLIKWCRLPNQYRHLVQAVDAVYQVSVDRPGPSRKFLIFGFTAELSSGNGSFKASCKSSRARWSLSNCRTTCLLTCDASRSRDSRKYWFLWSASAVVT